ncbi:MAG TPA: membrane dipeptidase [Solirubrobacteraceae bacterium]|nr:membrane dipeptidase [Solirubrobacteraceae bacterium]
MIVDLHAHYPMHLDPEKRYARGHMLKWESERVRALIIRIASIVYKNYGGPDDEPSVTVESMRKGDVGVALSMLYEPLNEFEKPFGGKPEPEYYDAILRQLKEVEDDIRTKHARDARTVHTRKELEDCLNDGLLAIVHAVEGGFQLGVKPAEIDKNVAELAQRGVAYVTLAHLFFRQVATNAPALPEFSDRCYERLFPQPKEGLTAIGRAAVKAMYDHRMLVDITHMSERSIADTFALLDELDEDKGHPVIAGHIACRFGPLSYDVTDATIERVADRNGVLGVIDSQHLITKRDNGNASDKTFDDTAGLIFEQIDHIHEVTGSYENIGIGSDLDGFATPSLVGLKSSGDMRELQERIRKQYGPQTAEKICSGNALRVLQARFP